MVKMIVVDLDGTILNENRKITDLTKQYLKELKENGYIIVIATGRIYASALKVTDGAEFSNYAITDNGACLYDMKTKEALVTDFIDPKLAFHLFDYYNENCKYISICDKNNIYKYTYEDLEGDDTGKKIKDKNDILSHCKEISHAVISMKDHVSLMEVYNNLIKKYKDLEVIIMQDSFSDEKWLDIMKKGTSKYRRIKDLSSMLHIHNDGIMAFGDGANDMEMIEKCGHGIALCNALLAVKEKASDITKLDHNHDGVVHYLKENLF